MAEFILFKPDENGGWMPVVVHSKGQVSALLSQGYRQHLPIIKEPENEVVTPPAVLVDNSSESGLKINQVDEKAISKAIKGLGLVKARKLVSKRPFKTIDDLYQVEPSINWGDIPINYEDVPIKPSNAE